MLAPEYPEAVLEYVQAQGWTTDITELRDGAYIVAGSRETDSASETMLLMVVCEPEDEVTSEHVEYLLKAAKQKNASAAALTANVGATSEAQQAIEESPISVIDADTVTSQTSTQIAGSPSQSVSEYSEETYEIYGSRSRMVLIGVGAIILGLGAVGIVLYVDLAEQWALLSDSAADLIQLFIAFVGVPLFIGGGIMMFYQAIQHDPYIRITSEGITHIQLFQNKFISWDDIEECTRLESNTDGIEKTTQVHFEIQLIEMSGVDDNTHRIPLTPFGIDFEEVAEAVSQYSDVPVRADM